MNARMNTQMTKVWRERQGNQWFWNREFKLARK